MTTFTVIGTPKPQGSKRAYIQGGHARLVESAGQPLRDWRTDVQQAAIAAHQGPPIEGPIVLQLTFTLHRPKSHYGTGRNSNEVKPSAPAFPTSRPDVDKLTRAVADSITHVCYHDDAQIVQLLVRKEWGDPPGVTITVDEAL